jgi:O-methyltransferase involved in polyketide biosynthesis
LASLPYLSLDAIGATLRALPACPLAVSYGTPEDIWHRDVRAASEAWRETARAAGEPILSRFGPGDFEELLTANGFAVVEDVGCEDVEPRYGIPALSLGNERIALSRKEG